MSSNYFIYEVVIFDLLDKPVLIDRLTKEEVFGNIRPDDFNFKTFLEKRRAIMSEKVRNIAIYGPDINYIIFIPGLYQIHIMKLNLDYL